jgi:hypothetical protein
MKDAYEVLRQKESDFARLRREIDALRVAIPLLLEQIDDVSKNRNIVESDVVSDSNAESMRNVNTN